MSQEYRILAAFLRRVHRGLYAHRLLQGGVLVLTIILALLLLGLGVQQLVPLVPLAAPIYSAVAVLVLLFVGVFLRSVFPIRCSFCAAALRWIVLFPLLFVERKIGQRLRRLGWRRIAPCPGGWRSRTTC